MTATKTNAGTLWRVVVVGGHTRSIGKTQLVCDIIAAFPGIDWIAGKITQYGHGVCAQNGENCDCAPEEHVCALDWEMRSDSGTDSARFLAAGARASFWLRTKQGYLAEGLPLLRKALEEAAHGELRGARRQGSGCCLNLERAAIILESNSLMQFVKPSLYFAVIDPVKDDFKESAQVALDRAHALILRADPSSESPPAPLWMRLPTKLLQQKPSVIQREGQPLPSPVEVLIHRMLDAPPAISL